MITEKIRQTKEGIWVIDGDSHLTKWIEETGRLDHDSGALDRLMEYVPVGGTVVDAGASVGDHTARQAQKVGPTGSVYAFEPNPIAFQCLVRNMADYPWVKCFPMGLGSMGGTFPLLQDHVNNGATRIATDANSIRVPVINLDSIGWLFPRFDFFKLDVEGFEVFAIDGAAELIRHFKPVIWAEVNKGCLEANKTSGVQLLNQIRELGYDISPAGDPTGAQFDVLCLPKKL